MLGVFTTNIAIFIQQKAEKSVISILEQEKEVLRKYISQSEIICSTFSPFKCKQKFIQFLQHPNNFEWCRVRKQLVLKWKATAFMFEEKQQLVLKFTEQKVKQQEKVALENVFLKTKIKYFEKMKFGQVTNEPTKNVKIQLEPDHGMQDQNQIFVGFQMNYDQDEVNQKDDKISEETKNNKKLKQKEDKKALEQILKQEIRKLRQKERSELQEEKKAKARKETCEETKQKKTKKMASSKKIKKTVPITRNKVIGRPKNTTRKSVIQKEKKVPKIKKYKKRLNKKKAKETIEIKSCSQSENKCVIYEGSESNQEQWNCKKRPKNITQTKRIPLEDGVVEIFYDNGDRYKGKLNENNLFHDQNGQYYTKDYEFKGSWENGKTNGPGITKYYDPSASQQGIYQQGYKRFGQGKDFYSNGQTYEGEFFNEQKSGYGVYFFKNVDCEYYKGQFKKNKQDGKGMEVFLNGDTYEGHWKQDERDGEGIFTCSTHKERQVYKKGKLISSSILDSVEINQMIV